MKSLFILTSVLCVFAFASCKKDYRCVCTNSNTGEVSYGDNMRGNLFTKKAAEESCKANNDVSGGGLTNCHLE